MAYNYYKNKRTVFPNREAKVFRTLEWTWTNMINIFIERLNIEKDVFVIVTGKTGQGKSHLTGNFCLKYFSKIKNFILNDGSMMFEKDNFITTAEEFAVKMITKSGSVLWIDEGRSSVSRRDWQQKMNKTIIGRKNTNRKLRNIIFLLLPFEREIDPNMVSHATLWMWVRRGTVEIYASAPNFKGSKGLDIQAILEREDKYRKENPNCKMVLPYIHPEFIGRLHFSALSTGYKKQYDDLVDEKSAVGELSEEEKLEFGMIDEVSPETKIKKMIELVKNGELIDKKELWDSLKKETRLDDGKLLRQLNFYLKLEELPTFAKLFS